MTCFKAVAGLALVAVLGGMVFTQEGSKKSSKKKLAAPPAAESLPATHKVEKKPFKIELTVKGILEAEETAAISYRPHLMVQPPPSQGPLTIRQIVPHGAKVKMGDLLVTFDSTKLDEVIQDLEKDKSVLETNIKLAEEELPLFQQSVPVELAAAETAKKRADEELKYFLEVGRPEAVKDADFMVKSAKFYVEFAEEELRQLQKMYKANDLTEDTEKIILRRQEHWLEMSKFFYNSALIERDYLLKYTLPNRDRTLKENQLKQDLQLQKARKTLEPTVVQKQAALVKMRYDHDKNTTRVEKLVKDRAAMTIHSPIEGVVYHGKFHKGQWSMSDALESKLVPQGSVTPDEVFLTVVKTRPVVVHLSIEEKDVHLLKPGLAGRAKMLVNPDRKLAARVTKLSHVPASPGKYEAQVVLDVDPNEAKLMPGMACTVKFVPYARQDALVVPATSVHEENDLNVVYVVGKSGKQETRTVTPGRSDGEQTEILSGLREGDEVLVERPGQKRTESTKGPAAEKGATP
jgi:multidrug efflux pump subunit AcrA (membrane-fusion protein)